MTPTGAQAAAAASGHWATVRRAAIRNLLIIAAIAVGFPVALVTIGVAHGFASGVPLSVTVLLDCFYFIAAMAAVFMCAGSMLMFLNRLLPPPPLKLPDDSALSQAPRPVPKVAPPKPYRIRLANFLGVAASEVGKTRSLTDSSMKFWTSLNAFVHHGPKSPALIRYFLDRIRRAVHGEESAQRPR